MPSFVVKQHILLLLVDVQRRELVLDALERGQHGLTVGGDRSVIGGALFAHLGPACTENMW